MATQLKHTDFAYSPPRSTVRVAFQPVSTLPPVTAELSKLPASVRNATLDQIAGAPPSQQFWDAAVTFYSGLTGRLAAMSGNASEAETNRAASEVHQTLTALLLTPAPNLRALGYKLKVYGEVDGYELIDADEIGKVLATDSDRLLPKQTIETDADWAFWTKCLSDIRANYAFQGLTDDVVDALANAETAATEKLIELPSRSAADVIAKVRAMSALGTMVQVVDLEPLMVELEAFTTTSPVSPAPAYTPHKAGLPTEWQAAYASYEAAVAAVATAPHDEPSDEYEALVKAECDAIDRVLAIPAPSAAELAVKLRLASQAFGWTTTAPQPWEALLVSDAERLGQIALAEAA